MHFFRKAFGLGSPAAIPRLACTRKKRRPLQFESLEAREVLEHVAVLHREQHVQGRAQDAVDLPGGPDSPGRLRVEFRHQSDYYYFNKDGIASPTLGLCTVPDFKLSDLPTVNGKYVINLPDDLAGQRGVDSARIYFSMDAGLGLSVNGDGSVNAPSLTADKYYDSVEFTINDPIQQFRNLNLNLTSVDQWGVPLQFKIDSTDTIDNPDHPIGTPTATTRLDVGQPLPNILAEQHFQGFARLGFGSERSVSHPEPHATCSATRRPASSRSG